MQPIQGTVTKRLNRVLDSFFREFQSEYFAGYCVDDFMRVYRELVSADGSSETPSLQKKLIDMFDAYGIPCEKSRETEYYRKRIEESDLPDFKDTESRLLLFLYRNFRRYLPPEEYLRRLADKLTRKEDEEWKSDSLRLRILKQLIKYGSCLSYKAPRRQPDGKTKKKTITIFGGKGFILKYLSEKAGCRVRDAAEYLHLLKDDIFDVLLTATKDQKKEQGTYGILKMADDLASAKFQSEGTNRKSLYLFALAYDMSFNAGDTLSSAPDIEKSLFRDYYNNNLMRYLHGYYRENFRSYKNPSGQGINYKNFAEVIYLYYLASELEPREKIIRSNEMIFRVNEEQKNIHLKIRSADKGGTRHYRSVLLCDDSQFFRLSEDELGAYVSENYNCGGTAQTEMSRNKGDAVRDLELETEQSTAFAVYRHIMGELLDALLENERWSSKEYRDKVRQLKKKEEYADKNVSPRDVSREFLLPTCNYGLWFTDISAEHKESLPGIADKIKKASEQTGLEISTENMEAFVETLKGMQRLIGKTAYEREQNGTDDQEHEELMVAKTNALYVDSGSQITRTKLLTAFYYLFNVKYMDNSKRDGMSFYDVFNLFSGEANDYLEQAFYQRIDSKNIFDVLLVFSSYAFLNM